MWVSNQDPWDSGISPGTDVFLKCLQGDFNLQPVLKTTNHFKNKSCLVQLLMSEVQLRGRLSSMLTATGKTGCHIPHLIANSKLPQSERKQRQDSGRAEMLKEF